MDDFKVIFYTKESGECPVEDFLLTLDLKMRAKIIGMIDILKEKGNSLREPYSRYIGEGIFELRIIFGNNISRVMYFFCANQMIVLTHGFIKKSVKTPRREIKIAKEIRKEFMKRCEDSNENENT